MEGDARWNAQIGELIYSFAENLIQSGRLQDARHELLQWGPIDTASPPSMERIVLWSINISLGRILRVEGSFRNALNATRLKGESDEFFDGGAW